MTDRQAALTGKPIRILVVEDDQPVCEALCRIIQSGGFETTAARNGVEALRLFDAVGADMVVTDIIMPGMEGIETIHKLRQRRHDIKIVAISGGSRVGIDDFLELAKKIGANATLAKPFSRDELLTTLDKVSRGNS